MPLHQQREGGIVSEENGRGGRGPTPRELVEFKRSLAHQISGKDCLWPEAEELSLSQLHALHGFRADVVGAIYRLYGAIPQPLADRILAYYFLPPEQMGESRA